jgi:hypothetical protein
MPYFWDECEIPEDNEYDLFTRDTELERRRRGVSGTGESPLSPRRSGDERTFTAA